MQKLNRFVVWHQKNIFCNYDTPDILFSIYSPAIETTKHSTYKKTWAIFDIEHFLYIILPTFK